jgi:outer membrane protein assembly factor BamA
MNQSQIAMVIAGILACGLSACDKEDTAGALEGRTVSAVQIRYTGNRVIDEVRLDNLISTKPGDRFTREAIDADVKSLYESGMVNDVRFLAEPDGDSVRLIAEVSTRPPFGPPFCIGNTAYSDKSLAEASGLTKERPITIEGLEKARQQLKAFYVGRGYLDAEVICRALVKRR